MLEQRRLGLIAVIVESLLEAHPWEVEAFCGGKADPNLASLILSQSLQGGGVPRCRVCCDEPQHYSTWLQPQDIAFDVAHQVLAHPRCV